MVDRNRREGSNLSITWKITIWYTIFLLIVAVLLSFTILKVYEDRIRTNTEKRLVGIVKGIEAKILEDGEAFTMDDRIRYYFKDTYLSVYGEDEELIIGRRPRGMGDFPPINADRIQSIKDASGSKWYFYDDIIEVNGSRLYIRGIHQSDSESDKQSFAVTLALTLIPIIMILAGIGGYGIARNAFAPIRRIIETTEDISKNGDLSKRIPLGKSHDEIYELSEAFNDMFDKVEELINKEKKFTADASHDLRTPLAIIQAQSEFAIEDETYAPEASKVINREARRMSSLINKLLLIVRSESGGRPIEKEALNVSDILNGLVEIKRPLADEKGLLLETEIEEGIIVETDEDMLTRIMVNLFDNAIKYNSKEGGTIRISAHKKDKEFTCRISDDGPGVEPKDRDMIWERFYRADAPRTNGESSGLGLAIVKALTNTLGGSIELLNDEESELGGATFEFRLPCKE